MVSLVERRSVVLFQGILDGCTHLERLALVRIALEGFVNPKLWPCVVELESRGVVARSDGLRLRGKAFRRFLRTHMEPKDIARLEQAEPSRWSTIRTPIMAIIAGGMMVLFLVAPDIAAVVATGLWPLLAGGAGVSKVLAGTFSGGRMGGARTA